MEWDGMEEHLEVCMCNEIRQPLVFFLPESAGDVMMVYSDFRLTRSGRRRGGGATYGGKIFFRRMLKCSGRSTE